MDLDQWISKVKDGQHLSEDELQLLCECLRVQAIGKLPPFCKDSPKLVSKIIDALVQCLDTDQQGQRDDVHGAFNSLFQQDTLIGLIDKSLGHVSGEEVNMFKDFLTSLSTFGMKAPQERMQELVKIVEVHANLDAKLKESDADHVDRLIPFLQAALPFILRGGPDGKFLNFLKIHVVRDFDKLPELRKLDLLKALAEISPHTTDLVASQMLPSIVQLLKTYMPAKKTVEKPDFRYVECLLYVLHHMAHKVPGATKDDFSELYKEFIDRLTNLEDLIKASMEPLVEEMREHDKASLRSNSMTGDEEASLYTKRQNTKTALRTCINILGMTEVLHAEAPSFIGDRNIVNLSWKKATQPRISSYEDPMSLDTTIPNLDSLDTIPNMDSLDTIPNMDSSETVPTMDGIYHLIDNLLSMDNLDKLDREGICELNLEDVIALVGSSGLQKVRETLPESRFRLHDNHQVACVLWEISQLKLAQFVTAKSWKQILGDIRDQLYHLLCWAYVASDLVSVTRILGSWEQEYIALCPWYLCEFCRPELYGKDNSAKEGHFCYGLSTEDALVYIQEHGIPREICKEFDCEDFEPPNADEPRMDKRKIKSFRTIETIEEALLLLPHHPIGAILIVFDELWIKGERIYRGPEPNSTGFKSYHAVIITSIEVYDGEVVAVCKMSNGTEVADQGYVRVSLATMYMIVGVWPKIKENVQANSKPMHLLSNFVIIEIDNKETDTERN